MKTHHHEHTHICSVVSYVPYSNTRMTSRRFYMCDLKQASDPCSRRGFNFFQETTQEVRTSSAVLLVTNWIFKETSGRVHAVFFAIKHYILDRKSGHLQTRLWRQHWHFLTRPQDDFQMTFGKRTLHFIQDIKTSAVVFVDTF